MANHQWARPHPVVVAEIGCNHMGRFDLAKQMIEVAASCGAHVVKFQKRTPSVCLTPSEYDHPYDSLHSFGSTYGEHREALEFTVEQHADLQKVAESCGVQYASSVWDIPAARQITLLNPAWLKIPSAHNENCELLRAVANMWGGDIHISNGMTTRETETLPLHVIYQANKCMWPRVVMYACTSAYPCEMKDVCILDVQRLRDYEVKAVGFSGHHKGIALDVAAVTLGAKYVERHFTLDRTWKGTDQAASLEPGGLAKLCRDLEALRDAWQFRGGLLPCEEGPYAKLKKNHIT